MGNPTAPKLGTIVNYRLSEGDASEINRRIADADGHLAEHRTNANGVQVHVGNRASEGEVYPAMVVRVWSPESSDTVQLQVFIDGNHTYWATSRQREMPDFTHGRYFD